MQMTTDQGTHRRIQQHGVLRHQDNVNTVMPVSFKVLNRRRFLGAVRTVRPCSLHFVKDDDAARLLVLVQVLQPLGVNQLVVEEQARNVGVDGTVVGGRFAFLVGAVNGRTDEGLQDFVDTIESLAAAWASSYEGYHGLQQNMATCSRRPNPTQAEPTSRHGGVSSLPVSCFDTKETRCTGSCPVSETEADSTKKHIETVAAASK